MVRSKIVYTLFVFKYLLLFHTVFSQNLCPLDSVPLTVSFHANVREKYMYNKFRPKSVDR